jgi:hypothetical protein
VEQFFSKGGEFRIRLRRLDFTIENQSPSDGIFGHKPTIFQSNGIFMNHVIQCACCAADSHPAQQGDFRRRESVPMKNNHLRCRSVPPKSNRHGDVDFRRIEIAEVKITQCRLVEVNVSRNFSVNVMLQCLSHNAGKIMKIKFIGTVAVLCLAGKIILAQAQPEVPPPPSILPFSPLARVVRLMQAGVDQIVILAYVTNSISTFNLDSDKIIYLADLGVPNEITTAMMQRDQILQQQMSAAANIAPTPTSAPDANTTDTMADAPPEPAMVTVDYFQTALAPYGSWVDIDGYGCCWRPTAVAYSPNWQPYCDRGHWVYSDAGWYWDSDYAWGATFHYGRWFRDARFGWCWWPDTTWAPSWVTWRYSDDYCGWAPMPPFAVYSPGVGFIYRGNGVSVGFDFGLSAQFFTFVPTKNFCDPHPRRFRAAPTEATRIYNQTKVINNINFSNHRVINNGITVQHIADVTRTQIRPVPVDDLRIQNNQFLRGENFDRQNRQPNTSSTFENGYTASRVQNPAQNHFSQPAFNGNPQPVQDWSSPASTMAENSDNERHMESPRDQQIGRQTPYPITPSQPRDFSTPLPPTVNRSASGEPSHNLPQPQPQTRLEQMPSHNDSRPTLAAPQNRSAPPPQSSDQRDKDQNGPGH